jgi:hypothetical protein
MKILPARMGPTVCELLGPTVCVRAVRSENARGRERGGDGGRTTDGEEVESGDDGVFGARGLVVLFLLGGIVARGGGGVGGQVVVAADCGGEKAGASCDEGDAWAHAKEGKHYRRRVVVTGLRGAGGRTWRSGAPLDWR